MKIQNRTQEELVMKTKVNNNNNNDKEVIMTKQNKTQKELKDENKGAIKLIAPLLRKKQKSKCQLCTLNVFFFVRFNVFSQSLHAGIVKTHAV